MKKISTNKRFDRLTNLDISTHYQNKEYYFMKCDFLAAFAYWVVYQSPYDCPDITSAIKAFERYIDVFIIPVDRNLPHKFSYNFLSERISGEVFKTIPEIAALNIPKIDTGAKYLFTDRYTTIKADYDFIDLWALACNIFYMLLRQSITDA